jgi:hypothetical protein
VGLPGDVVKPAESTCAVVWTSATAFAAEVFRIEPGGVLEFLDEFVLLACCKENEVNNNKKLFPNTKQSNNNHSN